MSAESNSEKSVSCQMKDGRGHTRPSFFWYDNYKDLQVCFLVTLVIYLILQLFFQINYFFVDKRNFHDKKDKQLHRIDFIFDSGP